MKLVVTHKINIVTIGKLQFQAYKLKKNIYIQGISDITANTAGGSTTVRSRSQARKLRK